MLDDLDSDWTAIKCNIDKANARWAMVKKVLVRNQTTQHTMGHFYKAVVQAVLLYGSETWVLNTKTWSRLTAFQHRIDRSLAGEHGHPDPRDPENPEMWIYPDMEAVLEKVGLLPIVEYIEKRREQVERYACRNSRWYRRCKRSKLRHSNKTYWWY